MVDFEYKERYSINDLKEIVSLLRSENGCPWDREQTHKSVQRNFLEEAYEVCEAIENEDPDNLCEELGDVLLQVIFHSRIEEEAGGFNIDDVADTVCRKLILRHPHVIGDVEVTGSDEVTVNWDIIKRKEKRQPTTASSMAAVAKNLPALWRAEKIQNKAAKVGFDWPDASGAMDKLTEETEELREAVSDNNGIFGEMGDILFAAVNTARLLHIDPESALHASCDKFIKRFDYMEKLAAKQNENLENMSLEAMEEYYSQAKKEGL